MSLHWSRTTTTNGPLLVGWDDGDWALGERVGPDTPWTQQGTGLSFNPPPTWFARVTPPPTEGEGGAHG